MLDFRHLQHLLALAEERHFGRAAERAHLSQPAFSRSIQALERKAGQRLFDRDAGNVRPTPAGDFLIERARQLLLQAHALERDVKLYGDGQIGQLAFGAGPFPAATIVPPVLCRLRQDHPDLELRLEVRNWAELLERLRRQDIEFFVADASSLPADPLLDIQALRPQPGRFFVRAGHPLAGRPCSPAEMWRHGVATTRLPPQLQVAIGRLLNLPGDAPAPLALQCDDVSLLRSLALSTDTVVGLTEAAAQADVQAGALQAVDVKGMPALGSQVSVVTVRSWTLSPMGARAITLLRETAEQLASLKPASIGNTDRATDPATARARSARHRRAK